VFCAKSLELTPDTLAHGRRICHAREVGCFGPSEFISLGVNVRDSQFVRL
jgi:hypothetical protein